MLENVGGLYVIGLGNKGDINERICIVELINKHGGRATTYKENTRSCQRQMHAWDAEKEKFPLALIISDESSPQLLEWKSKLLERKDGLLQSLLLIL
jgi:hypothetical protein